MTHDTRTTTLFAATLLLAFAVPSHAQQATPMLSNAASLASTYFNADTTSSSLPDAPSTIQQSEKQQLQASIQPAPPAPPQAPMAKRYDVIIQPHWKAQHLNGGDKIVLSLKDSYSPENFLAILFSAGYEQVTNGQPNYGTDKGAFGERLGAAGIRETSQGILSEGVFAAVFHEDPRYYRLGPDVNFVHRVIYSITRPIITRTDGGHNTFNAALISGYAATTAMSYAYYPPINQNAKDMASAFGGSIGGAAVGFFFNEFADDLLEFAHLKKRP